MVSKASKAKPAFNAFKTGGKAIVKPGQRRQGPGGARHMPNGGGNRGPSMPTGMSGWVWIPAGGSLPPAMMNGGRKGQGKGKATGAVKSDKHKEKLRSIDVSKKAWVGGLDKKTTWKKVEKHFKDADLKPVLVDVNERKGTAIVCFKTEDEVGTAVAALNGSELDGKTIEVDVWEKKPPKEDGEERPKKKKQPKKKLQIKNMLKGKAKKPVSKIAEKMKGISADLKIWVGGLAEGTTFKELSKHFEDQYAKPHLIDIIKNRACVTYKEADEVTSAISIVNGSELKGKTLEVDVWTKPEKKEKVKKEKES